MGWKTHEFECKECGFTFELFYNTNDELSCLDCGSTQLKVLLSVTNIGSFSAMSPDAQKASLMNRSAKHTQQQVDKEPERFGKEGIQRRTKKVQG